MWGRLCNRIKNCKCSIPKTEILHWASRPKMPPVIKGLITFVHCAMHPFQFTEMLAGSSGTLW